MRRFFAALLLAAGAAQAGDEGAAPKRAIATFAGGCFWCTESDFEKVPGVIEAKSGYVGGAVEQPTYEQVSAGGTGHAEAVQVVYDPTKVSYQQLLDAFWPSIDPTVKDRQFCDSGSQYRSAIFFHDAEQQKLALASKAALEKAGKLKGPIHTEIAPVGRFWPAEEYHQDYYKKNPIRYKFYRSNCGRDRRLEELWGKK